MNTEQERAAFEAWAASIGFSVTGKYAETLNVLCAESAFKAGYQAGQAALEAARADAERWRALREMDGGEIYALLGDCDGIHPEQADAAIDAAMEGEK